MDKIKIHGGNKLFGKIRIGGAKNAALPVMAASILLDGPTTLSNIPHLADIITMANLLMHLGTKIELDGTQANVLDKGRVIQLNSNHIDNMLAPYDIVRKMRASVWVLGPLVARYGYARVSLPGGCAIGTRPIDMHISALEQLGAEISLDSGYVTATTKSRLKGAEIFFDKVSVGATITAICGAALADGTSVIHNVAKEPEVMDVIHFLNAAGAKIKETENNTFTITGVSTLKQKDDYTIIADRIEAGTYAIAAAITGGNLELVNANYDHLLPVIAKLEESGSQVLKTQNGIKVIRDHDEIIATDITTNPFPGFPTDMQAQFMALMTLSNGTAEISETIFENRFMHAPELSRMGANIRVNGHTAFITGVNQLTGAEVMATDLRASVSLVLAALASQGKTIVNRVYHIDRGYERIEEKLAACGADIMRVSE